MKTALLIFLSAPFLIAAAAAPTGRSPLHIERIKSGAAMKPLSGSGSRSAELLVTPALLGAVTFHDRGIKGKGVIVGVYDEGIDWRHRDFRNADGTSRILYIWDQRLDSLKQPGDHRPPYAFANFGIEYTKAQLDTELTGSAPGRVRTDDFSAHGTHVAGIAASNGLARNARTPPQGFMGMAPEASLIIIRGRYGDASVIAALDYMDRRATELKMPLSVNFSFGDHFDAHDGTTDLERKVDAMFKSGARGRFITIAAGNNGNDKIHLRKTWTTADRTWEIPFSFKDYTLHAGQFNDYFYLSFWYPGSRNNHLSVTLYGPDASGAATRSFGTLNYSAVIPARPYFLDSVGYAEIYNAVDTANNMDNIILFVGDKDSLGRIVNPKAGNWKLVFSRTSSTAAVMDGWYCTHPEHFDRGSLHLEIPSSDYDYSVDVPATAKNALTVGGFISMRNWRCSRGDSVNMYLKTLPYYPEFDTIPDVGSAYSRTSLGPTRDGRQKPDLSAPAEVVLSALARNGYSDSVLRTWDTLHLSSDGTSMAAPHAAGIAALLLQVDSTLDQPGLRQILLNQVVTDAYTGTVPNNKWGYGKLHIDYGRTLGLLGRDPEPLAMNGLSAYPNPFNPSTTLRFNSDGRSDARLDLFDIAGRIVFATALYAPPAGARTFDWNARTPSGNPLPPGVYTARLKQGGRVSTLRLVLAR